MGTENLGAVPLGYGGAVYVGVLLGLAGGIAYYDYLNGLYGGGGGGTPYLTP